VTLPVIPISFFFICHKPRYRYFYQYIACFYCDPTIISALSVLKILCTITIIVFFGSRQIWKKCVLYVIQCFIHIALNILSKFVTENNNIFVFIRGIGGNRFAKKTESKISSNYPFNKLKAVQIFLWICISQNLLSYSDVDSQYCMNPSKKLQ
jgi:hypothetical protein